MHLLYVTSSLPYGAGEAFVLPELAALERRGHKTSVVPVHGRGSVLHEDERALDRVTLERPLVSAPIVAGAARQLLRAPRRSLRAALVVLRSRSPRILLKNLAVLPKALWLGREAERRRIDHIHAHWGATSSTMALIASELSGIPWSLTVHRWDIGENNLLALKVDRARFVRTINQAGLEQLLAIAPAGAAKASVLHMGVDLQPPAPQRPVDDPRILCAASLREVKGHTYLVEAVRLLKDRGVHLRVDCVGEGPLRSELEQLIAARGLANEVVLCGPLSHRVLLSRLSAGTWRAVVLASVLTRQGEHEGTPVSLLEAMSAGVPGIGTSTGGVSELLADGAGLLVPERDPSALADALQRVLEDEDLRAALREAGRRRIEEQFDVELITAELERRFETWTTV